MRSTLSPQIISRGIASISTLILFGFSNEPKYCFRFIFQELSRMQSVDDKNKWQQPQSSYASKLKTKLLFLFEVQTELKFFCLQYGKFYGNFHGEIIFSSAWSTTKSKKKKFQLEAMISSHISCFLMRHIICCKFSTALPSHRYNFEFLKRSVAIEEMLNSPVKAFHIILNLKCILIINF